MNLFKRHALLHLLLAVVLIPSFALASDLDEIPPPPIEWGKIPQSDLEMKAFPADTNASAVILCDYGESKVTNDFHLEFKRHLRVKILTEKGFEWGTHAVDLYIDRENGESIDDIEAVTYTLDGSGQIVEHEMDDDDVVKENVTDTHMRVKFTLPSLKPGCVIELRYTIESRSMMYIKDWTFQHSEPVLWSEYRVLHPAAIGFDGVTKGYEPFAFDDRSEPIVYYSGDVAAYWSTNMLKCNFRRWAMKNIPALRDEPYITTLDDYYSKVELQFSGYARRGGGVERVLHTWDELVKELMEHTMIGRRITPSGDVKDMAEKLTAGVSSPLEKMKALYAWVAKSIVWDARTTIYSKQSVDNVLESKKGSSADVNYLLISLCRAAGLQADPVILSTRANGKLQELYPIVTQFNLGIARITIDGRQYFLDATDACRPWNIVPSRILGVRALVLHDAPTLEWTSITSGVKSVTTTTAVVALDAEGNLKGTIEGSFANYANTSVRNSLKDEKPAKVAKDYFALELSKLTADSAEAFNKDSVDLPLVLKATVSSEGYGQAAGDLMYVNPHIADRTKDNPFKSPVRKFAVDYNYPRERTSIVTLTLPDSFEVKEVPPNKYLNLDGQVRCTREFTREQNQVRLVTKFEIVSKEVAPRNYQRLKEFYSSMIQMESEQLVLQKKPAAVSAAASAPVAQPVQQGKKTAMRKK